MSDDKWWREKSVEHDCENLDDFEEVSFRKEVGELIQGDDGVYRVVE